MSFKILWSGSSDSIITSDPFLAYGKGQKLKIWILFLSWSSAFMVTLKGIIIMFKQELNMIYRPVVVLQVPNGCFGQKMVILHIWLLWGTCNSSNVSLNVPVFLLGWLEFILTTTKIKLRFLFSSLSHRVWGNDGVWRPTLIFFSKGHICSRGVKWNMFWPWPIWN